MKAILLACVFGLGAVCAQAQWINQPTKGIPRNADGKANLTAPAPKTPDGKPDLTGLWMLAPGSGGITQLKPGDIQPWAQALSKEREEDLGKGSPSTNCLPFGFIGGFAKIVQTPGLMVMLAEDLTYRQIFMDGRELPQDPNPAWMGYSVGHWDGDTLVIESTGYNDRTWLDRGYPHTENLRITERIHRADFGHLEINITESDPKIYAKPWTRKVTAMYTADTDLIEYVCAENEKDRPHLVGKNSDETKNAPKLSPEILSRYVGTYEFSAKDFGVPGVQTLPFNVTLEGEELKLAFGNAPGETMHTINESTFTGVGGRVEFGKDDSGKVTHMIVKIAEGDFRGNKKK